MSSARDRGDPAPRGSRRSRCPASSSAQRGRGASRLHVTAGAAHLCAAGDSAHPPPRRSGGLRPPGPAARGRRGCRRSRSSERLSWAPVTVIRAAGGRRHAADRPRPSPTRRRSRSAAAPSAPQPRSRCRWCCRPRAPPGRLDLDVAAGALQGLEPRRRLRCECRRSVSRRPHRQPPAGPRRRWRTS